MDPNELFRRFFSTDFTPFSNFFSNENKSSANYFSSNVELLIQINLNCSLEDLYYGKTKKVSIERKNITSERATKIELKIELRRGWRRGTRITYRNEGNEVRPNTFQSICFIISEKPHKKFKRNKDNLLLTHSVSLLDSLVSKY